mgnify:CR=1 FL=1
MNPPVVFLIFANQPIYPLYKLTQERKGIEDVLRQADKSGYLRCISESSVATPDIFKIFDDYRGQIKVLHFGGHANGEVLDFTDQRIPAQYLADLIATENQIGNIELVFLNACATNNQVKALLEAGVKNVIATTNNIEDEQASQFAQQFYRSFVAGATIGEAYKKAITWLRVKYPNISNHLQGLEQVRGMDDLNDIPDSSELPWGLYTAENAQADYVIELKMPPEKQGPKQDVFHGGPIHNDGAVTNQINNLNGLEGGIKMG